LLLLLLNRLLLHGHGLDVMSSLFQQTHLVFVEAGQQALEVRMVFSVRKLKPLLRARQSVFFISGSAIMRANSTHSAAAFRHKAR
jgi:hypothetical protein